MDLGPLPAPASCSWGAPEPASGGEQFIPRDPLPIGCCPPAAREPVLEQKVPLSQPSLGHTSSQLSPQAGNWDKVEGDVSLSPVMSTPLPHPTLEFEDSRQKMPPYP